MVFRVIGLDETEAEARLRRAACLLTDIGWRAHPEYRGEQSLSLIAHAAFIGIDHPGRAYLALANFYRHEGLIDEQLSPRLRELVGRASWSAPARSAPRSASRISSRAPCPMSSARRVEAAASRWLVLPKDLAPLGGAACAAARPDRQARRPRPRL
jgi:exopolyphosphatase/guanosine-5'-triphosphate,3'-diphosphate pyrophosphatase